MITGDGWNVAVGEGGRFGVKVLGLGGEMEGGRLVNDI